MRHARFGLLSLVAVLGGCLSGPGFFQQRGSLATVSTVEAAKVLSDENGVVTARLEASTTLTQVVSASGGLAGATVSFPPGTLAVATDITVQEGVTLATAGFASEVGLDTEATAAAPTLVVTPTDAQDPTVPFTLSINVGSGLALQGGTFAVLYKVFVAATGQYRAGVMPTDELEIDLPFVRFKAAFFGAFQVVRVPTPVKKIDVASTQPIVTQKQAAAAPLELDGYRPIAAGKGARVVLTGKNFRQTMVLAVGKRRVTDLRVESDVSASFAMPDVGYGFADLDMEQDGVVQTGKMFARADKTELPLITMDEGGVCAGINYYDAEGNKKTGTRDCSGSSSVPADVMKKGEYDTNGDGKVDKANASDTAGTAASAVTSQGAAEAAYALGKQGTNPTFASGMMTVVPDGTFFVADFGGVPQISAINQLRAGTRITVFFVKPVVLRHSDGAVKFGYEGTDQLLEEKSTVEFLSIGASGWLTTHVYGRGSGFEASFADNDLQGGFANISGSGSSGSITVNWDGYSIEQDTAMQYNAATDEFVAILGGTYHVEWGVYFAFSGSGMTISCELQLFKNGSTQFTGGTYDYAYAAGYCRNRGDARVELAAGQTIKAKGLLGATSANISSVNLSSSATNGRTFIRIRRDH